MYGMQRIWVLCKHCGTNDTHAFFGAKPIGIGTQCPTCGYNWRQSHIIASGDLKTLGSQSPVKVMWLDT